MKLFTTEEVALKYGVKNREVLYAARKGLLRGRKIGWVWTFDPEHLPEKWPVRKKGKSLRRVS